MSRQNKKLKEQHNWKKVPPAHVKQVYLFLCLSVCLSVCLSIRKGQESGVKECKPY
jgi:hypothetical protein